MKGRSARREKKGGRPCRLGSLRPEEVQAQGRSEISGTPGSKSVEKTSNAKELLPSHE